MASHTVDGHIFCDPVFDRLSVLHTVDEMDTDSYLAGLRPLLLGRIGSAGWSTYVLP
jgi:hypothetical protein